MGIFFHKYDHRVEYSGESDWAAYAWCKEKFGSESHGVWEMNYAGGRVFFCFAKESDAMFFMLKWMK